MDKKIFTDDEKAIIHNFNKAKKLKMTVGLNEGYGTFEDILITDDKYGIRVERNTFTDDGGHIDVEDVTDDYLDMEFISERK